MLIDFGLLRLAVNRPVEVVPGIWRSNQPTPWRLNNLARRGFHSVLNLRGQGANGSVHLEDYCCDQLNLKLYSIKLSSRKPPTKEQVTTVLAILENAPKPLLLHCKSGADRAGLVAAIAQLNSGIPVSQAKRQLSLKYLHIKRASTGMMDYFIESFEKAQSQSGMSFGDWLETDYDRDAMIRTFKADGLGNLFVDTLLKRE